jgi:DNA-binding GntR family transcriptional regulator
VEGKWAAKFGVARASIREAINVLSHAGFITKAPGCSSQVIHWNETDIGTIYELRGAIEGLAACLAAKSPRDLVLLQGAMDEMREAANTGQP